MNDATHADAELDAGSRVTSVDDVASLEELADKLHAIASGEPAARVVAALGMLIGYACWNSTKPGDLEARLESIRWFAAEEIYRLSRKPQPNGNAPTELSAGTRAPGVITWRDEGGRSVAYLGGRRIGDVSRIGNKGYGLDFEWSFLGESFGFATLKLDAMHALESSVSDWLRRAGLVSVKEKENE